MRALSVLGYILQSDNQALYSVLNGFYYGPYATYIPDSQCFPVHLAVQVQTPGAVHVPPF